MANRHSDPLEELSLQERIRQCIADGPSNRTLGKRLYRGLKNPRLFWDFLDARLDPYLRRRRVSDTPSGAVQTAPGRQIGPYKSYSQSFQDLFVLEMTERKHNGHYLEIGAYDAVKISNTYVLETEYAWMGVSFEIDEARAENFNKYRNNNCIPADATSADYGRILADLDFPRQIDYLSVDIEPPWNTLAALNAIPLERYRFSVITYEHDRHLNGPDYMNLSRELLETNGYRLVVANVKNNGLDYEDWYVDPSAVPESVWSKYSGRNIEYSEIFKSLA